MRYRVGYPQVNRCPGRERTGKQGQRSFPDGNQLFTSRACCLGIAKQGGELHAVARWKSRHVRPGEMQAEGAALGRFGLHKKVCDAPVKLKFMVAVGRHECTGK